LFPHRATLNPARCLRARIELPEEAPNPAVGALVGNGRGPWKRGPRSV
jgi:hypothetical protein